MELLESKTSVTKLLSEQEILADSLLLYSISGGTGRAQPPSAKPLRYKRTVCVALNYLNSSVLLPMMDLDVSVGQDGEEGEMMQLESSATWFLEWQQKRCAQGQAVTSQRAAVPHCCFKGKHFKSCSQTTVW